ncbi:MAG TPA: hypothetical protein VI072_14525 [Polyangiaceae bacterium]
MLQMGKAKDRTNGGQRLQRILLEGAEASALERCGDAELLRTSGFDEAFWGALDEGPIEENLILVGHRAGAGEHEGWACQRLSVTPDFYRGRTDDAEGMARHGGHIYVLGSHFGGRKGPLDPRRAFIARFEESAARGALDGRSLNLAVRRTPFLIHRIVNDALQAASVELMPPGSDSRRAYIRATSKLGAKRNKQWAPQIADGDLPINVEGFDLLDDGRALLGLRFPCTAAGQPIILCVTGLPQLFEAASTPPSVESIYILEQAGSKEQPAGVRALHRKGRTLHVVSGPVTHEKRDEPLARDFPGTVERACEHWELDLPAPALVQHLRGKRLEEFDPGVLVEGLTQTAGGRFIYAVDSAKGIELQVASQPS